MLINKFSVKTDLWESEGKKNKRERQIKSPTAAKTEFGDIDMFSDGFSVRTIEESINTKQGYAELYEKYI